MPQRMEFSVNVIQRGLTENLSILLFIENAYGIKEFTFL